jgi:hypothetical protein
MVQLKNFRGIPHSHKDNKSKKEIYLKNIFEVCNSKRPQFATSNLENKSFLG